MGDVHRVIVIYFILKNSKLNQCQQFKSKRNFCKNALKIQQSTFESKGKEEFQTLPEHWNISHQFYFLLILHYLHLTLIIVLKIKGYRQVEAPWVS